MKTTKNHKWKMKNNNLTIFKRRNNNYLNNYKK